MVLDVLVLSQPRRLHHNDPRGHLGQQPVFKAHLPSVLVLVGTPNAPHRLFKHGGEHGGGVM